MSLSGSTWIGDKSMNRKSKEEELRLMTEARYTVKIIEPYINKVNIGAKNPDIVTTHLGPCGDFTELQRARVVQKYVMESV